MEGFVDRLQEACVRARSLLCIGLDPDPELMPISDVLEFNKGIVDATGDLVCAYKPNLSFYEALGRPGFDALEGTVSYIRSAVPAAIVIGDGKRGDVSSSSAKYAQAIFETWGFDAATVNGYAGGESIAPFLDYADRGVFVWCRSSNPGAGEFQSLLLSSEGDEMPLYAWMAHQATRWNNHGNVGLVVGSTYPDELAAVRARCPGMPILVPGVGAQGGILEQSVRHGLDDDKPNVIISSSRGILYASPNRADYADAARRAAENLRDRINRILREEGRGWS